MSDCPFKKEISLKEWEDLKARVDDLEEQNNCPLEHRICSIEEKLAELEKGKPEPEPKQRKWRMTELLIKSCGKCPYYHVGEAEYGHNPKRICTFGGIKHWKEIPKNNAQHEVLDDCPLSKNPVTLIVK